jgi:glycosyltransferase involved in cell wall biosynthesis
LAPRGVLYCIDSLVRGGTELQLAGLIRRLDRSRFRPHLCTLRPGDPALLPEDCPHLALEVPALLRPGTLGALRRTIRTLRREGIAVVQTFFQDATAFGAAAARLAGVPVRLASFRDLGFWRTPRLEFQMRRAYPLLTGFLANSEAVKEHFCRRDGLDPARVAVIPNGVEVARYEYVEHDGEPPAVGIVGNLNRRVKRTDLFLAAAGRLAAAHPGVSWHVVGDGSLRERCEAQARELGIAERVVFAGRCGDVPGYLGRLGVGVNCSDSEGFSNAVLEYMLRGCAVVATDVGGNREAVRHGETGLLVPPGDAGALAAAVERLLTEPGLRRRLARRAREEAVRRFAWERCVAAHEAHYLSALAAAGAGTEEGAWTS